MLETGELKLHERAEHAAKAVGRGVERGIERGVEQVGGAFSTVRDGATRIAKERPFTVLLATLAVGIVFGRFALRR